MARSARCARAEEPQGEAKANDCPGRGAGAGAGAGPWAERRIPAWHSGLALRPEEPFDCPFFLALFPPSRAHAHAR